MKAFAVLLAAGLLPWLVESGWVDAQPGSPLAAAGEKAKQAKQGIHGEDPRRRPAAAVRPETAAPL